MPLSTAVMGFLEGGMIVPSLVSAEFTCNGILCTLLQSPADAFAEYYHLMSENEGSSECCVVTNRSNKMFHITDDTPLVVLLSSATDPGKLYSMIASIVSQPIARSKCQSHVELADNSNENK